MDDLPAGRLNDFRIRTSAGRRVCLAQVGRLAYQECQGAHRTSRDAYPFSQTSPETPLRNGADSFACRQGYMGYYDQMLPQRAVGTVAGGDDDMAQH
ncbi:hypothetical protein IAT40_004294 [Kwoniella sp. CBS 6097]